MIDILKLKIYDLAVLSNMTIEGGKQDEPRFDKSHDGVFDPSTGGKGLYAPGDSNSPGYLIIPAYRQAE